MMKNFKKSILLISLLIVIAVSLSACSSSSSSCYSLHNKDGSLNMQYVQDMSDYFEKHPEKLP